MPWWLPAHRLRAVCPNPICTPSRAEIMSGACSFHNGVLDFGGKLKPELKLWAQAMRDGGYQTWYVGKWHNDGWPTEHGYDETAGLFTGGGARWDREQADWKGFSATGYRGWIFRDHDRKPLPELGVGLSTRTSRQIADAAIGLLRRSQQGKPFFLHVNFTSPHDPLLMPPELAGKYDPQKIPLPANFLPQHPFDHGNLHGRDEEVFGWPRTPDEVRGELACYYAVITQMDAEIGRILAALDESGHGYNTIVIFSSDHGLAIGSHGLRRQTEHVRAYDRSAARHARPRHSPASHGGGPGLPSRPLPDRPGMGRLADSRFDRRPQPVAAAGRPDQGRIYPEVFGYFRDLQRMVRGDRWKLIYYPKINRSQLFDLASDPAELHDLSADPAQAAVLADLRSRLLANQRPHGDPLAAGRQQGPVPVRHGCLGDVFGSRPGGPSPSAVAISGSQIAWPVVTIDTRRLASTSPHPTSLPSAMRTPRTESRSL